MRNLVGIFWIAGSLCLLGIVGAPDAKAQEEGIVTNRAAEFDSEASVGGVEDGLVLREQSPGHSSERRGLWLQARRRLGHGHHASIAAIFAFAFARAWVLAFTTAAQTEDGNSE